MVFLMFAFVRSVRTGLHIHQVCGDWNLYLSSLFAFTKYFFAHDKRNYARMIPVYISEIQSLKQTDPEIQQEFDNGHWVVNKNKSVSFCGMGADHVLEQLNRKFLEV